MPGQLQIFLLVFLAFSSSFTSAATAVTSKFSGELSISSTYLKPLLQGAFTATLPAAKIAAGEVPYYYFAQRVSPDTTGDYTFTIESGSAGLVDTVLFVYAGNFDPAKPLLNVLAGNDDVSEGNKLSKVTNIRLTEDAFYVLVVSSFTPGENGAVNYSAVGAGAVAAIENHRIEQLSTNVNLSGTVVITAAGVINGGTINGSVVSSGTITGRVNLGPASSINGGTITGTLIGDAAHPALIENAVIAAGARLENVIIGSGNSLSPQAVLGANVQFSSSSAIPAGHDLTGALPSLVWRKGDSRKVPALDVDVVAGSGGTAAPSILRGIQLLDGYEPDGNELIQNSTTGELLLDTTDSLSAVLPVRVTMAAAATLEPGTYVNDDGDVVFVSTTGRVVLGYPVLVDNSILKGFLLAKGLQQRYNSRADLRIDPVPGGNFYLSGRAEVSALRTFRYQEEGLFSHPIAGLAAQGFSIVFRSDSGRMMEQDLVPVPADWPAFKRGVYEIPGVSEVSINSQGIVSVLFRGKLIRGRASYVVNKPEGVVDQAGTSALLEVAGDLNGDGSSDYRVHYPNGDVQELLIYPQG